MQKLLYQNFTKQQKRVIKTKRPFVEVQAFAGAGKTAVLNARIEYLHSKGIGYHEILALGFSTATVGILRRRLPDGVLCQTFHSFGFGLVCQHHVELGLHKKPSFLKKKDVPALVKEAIEQALINLRGKKRKNAMGLIENHLSMGKGIRLLHDLFKLKRSGKTIKGIVNERRRYSMLSDHVQFVRSICRKYQGLKQSRGLIEFDDMINLGRDLVKKSIRLPFKHILVDEYQDSPLPQQKLLKALCQLVPNLMVVGDRFQAIYGFLGGHYTPLDKLVADAKTYSLTQSFRLTRSNARFTNAVLYQELGQDKASIEGTTEEGSAPIAIKCESPQAQSDIVVERIRSLLDAGVAPTEIVVLARANAQIAEIDAALRHAHINAGKLYSSPSGADLRQVLRLVKRLEHCQADDKKVLHIPSKVRQRIKREFGMPEERLKKCLRMYKKVLENKNILFESTFLACVKIYYKLCGGKRALGLDRQTELNKWRIACKQSENIIEFKNKLRNININKKVQLATIHGAKGGEWLHVFLIYVTRGSMPLFRATSDSALAAEKNLFYVAITRTKQQLYLLRTPYTNANANGGHREGITFKKRCPYLPSRKFRKMHRNSHE